MEHVSESTGIHYLRYCLKSSTIQKGEEYSSLAVAVAKKQI